MIELRTFLDFEILQVRNTVFTIEFFIINLIFPLILLFILAKLFRRVAKLIFTSAVSSDSKKSQNKAKKHEERTLQRYEHTTKLIRTLTRIAAAIIIFRLLLLLLSLQQITEIFTTPFFITGDISISFFSIIQIIILFYVANILSKLSARTLQRYIIHYFHIKNKNSLGKLLQYSTMVIVVFVGFPFIGIDIGSLNLVFGALGFGIGFGLQDVVGNFIAGITINTSHLVNEGDRVLVMDIEGTVQQINMLHTVIRNLSGDELIIPNKYITSNPVQNFTHSDSFFYVKCAVSVAYSSDLHLVERVMREAAESMKHRAKSKEIYFRVKEFADSGIKVAIFVCIKDVQDRYASSSDMHLKVWGLFQYHNIEIPYPQLDLSLKDTRAKEQALCLKKQV